MSTFYAYANLTSSGSIPAETVVLTFAGVDKANQWWEIISSTSWPSDIGIKKDNCKRSSPQWFTWPNGKGGAAAVMKALEASDALKPVQGSWSFAAVSDSDKPVIPPQDEKGNFLSDPESQKKITELEAKLKEAESSTSGTSTALTKPGAATSGAVSTTGGANWKGGARFQGGPQHYAMVADAYKMALELKDRGDDRSFSMIFAQLNMEQRRTVGIKDKSAPEGGYNSSKLIDDIYAKAKELKDKGDDRSFSMIFASLSMAYRRGQVQW